jgi:hypothetical protein
LFVCSHFGCGGTARAAVGTRSFIYREGTKADRRRTKRVNAILKGLGDPHISETSRLPHCPGNRHAEGGEVSARDYPHPQKDS